MYKKLPPGNMGVALSLVAAQTLARDEDALRQAPPPAPNAGFSKLFPPPGHIPRFGALFVDPATLPANPFLGYDRDGKLSATVQLTPLEGLRSGAAMADRVVAALRGRIRVEPTRQATVFCPQGVGCLRKVHFPKTDLLVPTGRIPTKQYLTDA
ncbi:hypothetical protein [Nisaea sp.]|uniref:hypothetical protein n=1 Tax=Nisaea sp. TaxID=2024842 RepID=UPI003B5225AA